MGMWWSFFKCWKIRQGPAHKLKILCVLRLMSSFINLLWPCAQFWFNQFFQTAWSWYHCLKQWNSKKDCWLAGWLSVQILNHNTPVAEAIHADSTANVLRNMPQKNLNFWLNCAVLFDVVLWRHLHKSVWHCHGRFLSMLRQLVLFWMGFQTFLAKNQYCASKSVL